MLGKDSSCGQISTPDSTEGAGGRSPCHSSPALCPGKASPLEKQRAGLGQPGPSAGEAAHERGSVPAVQT